MNWFVRAQYGKRVWYRYLVPRRLTLHRPHIWRWVHWNFMMPPWRGVS